MVYNLNFNQVYSGISSPSKAFPPILPGPFPLPSIKTKPSASLRKLKAQEQMAIALQNNLQFPRPICNVDFTKGKPNADRAKVSYDPGNWDWGFFGSMILEKPGISFVQADLENFKKDPSKTYLLELSHSRMVEEKRHFDFIIGIDISVNGQIVRKDHQPPTGGREFRKEQFDITPFLKEGNNQIRIELSRQDGTLYAIRGLTVFMQ